MARPRYVRHRKFSRLRHSRRFLRWLDEQADRLESTPEGIFNLMVANRLSYQDIENLDVFPEVPVNEAPPTITGTAEVGQELTAVPGEWEGEPTPSLSYQWFRDGEDDAEPIPGATGLTYEVTEEDGGFELFVRETAVNGFGIAFADSDNTNEVPVNAAPTNDEEPTIAGDPEVGGTLTVTPGEWSGTPTPTLAYQWQTGDGENFTNIDGATSTTYELQAEDEGNHIRIEETATNSEGSASANSASVGPVTNV